MISKETLFFLKELKINNNRDWFLLKNNDYQQAKKEFTQFVQKVISLIGLKHKEFAEIDAAKCLFRINRDVRFSANKAPYKTNFGASINIYGKKSPKAGLYIHLEPGGSFAGGGVYLPPADVLFKVRQEIDYNYKDFSKIIKNKDFIRHYRQLDMSDTLKNPPRGFEKDNEAIDFLKLKSYIAIAKLSDKEILQSANAELVAEKLIALVPLLNFINKSLDD